MKRLILIIGLLTSFAYAQSKAGFYVVGGKVITVQDTSSQKYLKAVENAGVVTSITQNFASNFLVTTERAIGSYSLMTAQYPFIGGTATTHSLNMNNPNGLASGYTLSFLGGGWIHSATGAKPNGTTSYANTFLPQNFNTNLSNIHVSYYSFTNIAQANQIEIGSWISFGSSMLVLDVGSAVGYIAGTSSPLANVGSSYPNSLGYYLLNRNSSSNISFLKNGVLGSTNTQTINTVSSSNVIVISALNANSSIQNFSNRGLSFSTIGAGLTDTQAIQQSQIVTSFNGFLNRQ